MSKKKTMKLRLLSDYGQGRKAGEFLRRDLGAAIDLVRQGIAAPASEKAEKVQVPDLNLPDPRGDAEYLAEMAKLEDLKKQKSENEAAIEIENRSVYVHKQSKSNQDRALDLLKTGEIEPVERRSLDELHDRDRVLSKAIELQSKAADTKYKLAQTKYCEALLPHLKKQVEETAAAMSGILDKLSVENMFFAKYVRASFCGANVWARSRPQLLRELANRILDLRTQWEIEF
jgi:hypothetical protein